MLDLDTYYLVAANSIYEPSGFQGKIPVSILDPYCNH